MEDSGFGTGAESACWGGLCSRPLHEDADSSLRFILAQVHAKNSSELQDVGMTSNRGDGVVRLLPMPAFRYGLPALQC